MSKTSEINRTLAYAAHLLEQQEATMAHFLALHNMEPHEPGADHLCDCILNLPTREGYCSALQLMMRERFPMKKPTLPEENESE